MTVRLAIFHRSFPSTLQSGSVFVRLTLLLLFVTLSACTSTRALEAQQERQQQAIDSLRAVNVRLAERNTTVEDSLQLIKDVDSGQYFRDRRVLVDSITALRFALIEWQEGGKTVDRLSADALFRPASAQLTEGGMTRLDSVAARIARSFDGRILRVEGHSDDVPIGPSLADRYPSNWELSAARAAAVARYLLRREVVDPAQIRVVGYGSSQPVATNGTAAGRSENRRVVITALPAEGNSLVELY